MKGWATPSTGESPAKLGIGVTTGGQLQALGDECGQPGPPDPRSTHGDSNARPRGLVSLTQAAEILGVSTKSVRRHIAAGELDAVRIGRRRIRIKTVSLDRLIDAHPINAWRNRPA